MYVCHSWITLNIKYNIYINICAISQSVCYVMSVCNISLWNGQIWNVLKNQANKDLSLKIEVELNFMLQKDRQTNIAP